jgi:ketosteroid isomerase-like protein
MTSADQTITLVRRYFAECVQPVGGPERAAALAAVDELLTADFVMFYGNDTDAEAMRGRDRHKAFLVNHARNFPEDVWTVDSIVAVGERVACEWRIKATHAATGNPVDVRAADFIMVRDGQLAELRRYLDFESFHRQLEQR